MAADNKASHAAYCIIETPHALVFPAEIAVQLFPLLCRGEPVQYDWTEKTHKRVKPDRDGAVLKQFTLAQYASLVLNSED